MDNSRHDSVYKPPPHEFYLRRRKDTDNLHSNIKIHRHLEILDVVIDVFVQSFLCPSEWLLAQSPWLQLQGTKTGTPRNRHKQPLENNAVLNKSSVVTRPRHRLSLYYTILYTITILPVSVAREWRWQQGYAGTSGDFPKSKSGNSYLVRLEMTGG